MTSAANVEAGLSTLVADTGEITSITASNGPVVVSASTFLADQSTLDKIVGGFVISDTAAYVVQNLNALSADPNITSITASNGPVVVSASTFLADQSTLDKIVDGFVISDTAVNLSANLGQLNDPNIDAITISDNGQIGASVQQLTTDATAIGKLQNAGGGAYQLAVVDSASNVLAGLSILEADVARIASITATGGTVTVATAIFLADQNALDKIFGGFDVSDTAANVVAKLPNLDANSHVAAVTVISGSATLSGGGAVNVANLAETGSGTSLTVSEKLGYAGAFTQGAGSKLSISSADTLSLSGTASGTASGAGTLALAGGSNSINSGATISVANLSISGSGTSVTLGGNLSYAGGFSEAAGDTFVLSGGHLLLTGGDTFSGGTVDGSKLLETEGTTTVSGLTIGGTVEWENTNTVNESGGTVTIGDASGDKAILFNTAKATYDILDNSGIGLGASMASYIDNAGLFEKTGGAGTSVIAPSVTNTGAIEVAAGTLDVQGAVTGAGSDIISGPSTLEFNSTVAAGQTVSFTGSGGTLDLGARQGFAAKISGFDTVGTNDTIEVAGPWIFSRFTENAGGTQGTLGFANGASHLSLTLIGDYTPPTSFINRGRTEAR